MFVLPHLSDHFIVPVPNGFEVQQRFPDAKNPRGYRMKFLWFFSTLDALYGHLPSLLMARAERFRPHNPNPMDLSTLVKTYQAAAQAIVQHYTEYRAAIQTASQAIAPNPETPPHDTTP